VEQRTNSLHVVLGAGQIGARVADILLGRGERVRLVKRSQPGAARPNLAWASGDITDPAFAEEATRGAAVVYDCMNPQYHQWSERLLPMGRGAVHGPARAGARPVALDCLYMYGRPSGPMREGSPLAPCSRKGELRVELAKMRLAAHRKGDVRVAIGRASDFLGTDLPFSCWSGRFYARVLAGKPAECMGDPDMPHAYTYVDDVAPRPRHAGGARRGAGARCGTCPPTPPRARASSRRGSAARSASGSR